ncbi:hypothetical protein GCM10023185_41230 [Hymenobacter saemangeumensis]|uniref:OmpA-like domain-containing protein n=1 Tax=Hymenobacter saemangeumensis TaxID=1084522 RepID=A0ABP8IR94_9BACT
MWQFFTTLILSSLLLPATLQAQRKPELVPELVFEDNFVDNRHKWPVGRMGNATFTLANGEYVGEETQRINRQQVATVPVPLQPGDDFVIEAEYRTSHVGTLAWGVANTDNMQIFGIEPDQGVAICGWENGSFFWTGDENLTSRAVRNNDWNTLRLERRGGEVLYFINDKKVGRFPFRGRVGPGLGLETNRGSTARLRRLRVWHLVPAPAPTAVAPPSPAAVELPEAPAAAEALAGTLTTGQRLTLRNVLFVQGQAKLLPSSKPELAKLTQALRQRPSLTLRLEGHTERFGDSLKNEVLSQQRVETVKKYLVDGGIAAERLSTEGFGQRRPLNRGGSEADRRRNRRVEMVVTHE